MRCSVLWFYWAGKLSTTTIPMSQPTSHFQSTYQNPNQSNSPLYAGKICVHEQYTFIFKWFYLVSDPLFDEFKQQNDAHKKPGLEPNFKEEPDSFRCHLSFTISSFANLPHKDNNSSPFKFVIRERALWSVPGKPLHILT
ncbi:hypothetical protein VP01_10955g1 [Puccinia sorghi]|uniref:Tet-like 2OG-Fe(II) oxygenase domain-containing protein n=1 Tax=Puccinia sorghi TaxID=27349 RepID=A0A0L6VT28_9BASI|nr:hypothetical protein VP01_10955g1 [Puccinia sorghi]